MGEPELNLTAEEITRVKGLGFLNNRGTEKFSARVLTGNTCLTSKELNVLSEAAERFAEGKVSLTSRQAVEVMGIPYENLEDFAAFIQKNGLLVGGTGDKVRPVTACKGTVCKFGKIDTHAIAQTAHERFYIGGRERKLPHKFKIGIGGCAHNCIKPMLNDIGLVGSMRPIFHAADCRGCKKCGCEDICPVDAYAKDETGKRHLNRRKCIQCGRCADKCPFKVNAGCETGIRVFVGGTWGKEIRIGKPIRGLYTQAEAMELIEGTLQLFETKGQKKERLGKMIQRLGFTQFQKDLLNILKEAKKANATNA